MGWADALEYLGKNGSAITQSLSDLDEKKRKERAALADLAAFDLNKRKAESDITINDLKTKQMQDAIAEESAAKQANAGFMDKWSGAQNQKSAMDTLSQINLNDVEPSKPTKESTIPEYLKQMSAKTLSKPPQRPESFIPEDQVGASEDVPTNQYDKFNSNEKMNSDGMLNSYIQSNSQFAGTEPYDKMVGTLNTMQNREDNNATKKYAVDKKYSGQGAEDFQLGSKDRKLAEYFVDNNVPLDLAYSTYSGFSGKSGKRDALLSTMIDIANEKGIAYDPGDAKAGFAEKVSKGQRLGALSNDVITKEGDLTHTRAMANLSPDVQTGKIEQQARGQTSKTLNTQRMAAQRALSTFDDAYDRLTNKHENIPDWMYRDLASDYAKILVSSGQISEGGVDKIMQKSAKGAIVNIWNYATGDTKTTAPEKVLTLLHDRIKALNTDLDKQFYNQTKGENITVNSDESTNPLSTNKATTQPLKATKRYNPATRKLETIGQ
jgi:hypothetical protein